MLENLQEVTMADVADEEGKPAQASEGCRRSYRGRRLHRPDDQVSGGLGILAR